MNHQRKKSAIAKYGEAIKADITTAETQMAKDGYTPEEIAEVTEAVGSEGEEESKPAKQESQKPVKASKKDNAYTGLTFEKTKVNVIYELNAKTGKPKLDENDEKIFSFEKVKVLRNVKISQEQANILNSGSESNKIRYYLKES